MQKLPRLLENHNRQEIIPDKIISYKGNFLTFILQTFENTKYLFI